MMQSILEKYFIEKGQLVLPDIGYLSLDLKDAVHQADGFEPPVEKIAFELNLASSTQPSKIFYIYLSDHLDCTIDQAIIDYSAFFTNQLAVTNKIDLGNLGQLNIANDAYTFESNFKSSNYFKSFNVDKVQSEDQSENNFNTKSNQWWILPLIIAITAILAILLKL